MKFFKSKTQNTVVPPVPIVGTAGSLREFVYLDEVSVYSLTSAPDMPPPVTMSESADATSGEALTTQIEGSAPLVAKVNMGGELSSSRSSGLQVQRQFNIQSQFARLHGMYRPIFLLTANAADAKVKKTTELSEALAQLKLDQRAVRADELTRGALAETRVSLRAHHTFDLTALIRIMTGLFKKYPDLLGGNAASLQTVMDGGELLSELMEDLVPIEGRSSTHEIVTATDGEVWIVEIEALHAIYDGHVTADPLRVVGVAESTSFWKDTRRILHAEAEFDVLGRISRSGLQDEWTPVKMIDTFKRVIPSAASQLLEAVDKLKDISDVSKEHEEQVSVLVLAGTRLDQELANEHGLSASGPSLETLVSLLGDDSTLEGRLAALNRVADTFYESHAGLERDEDVVGRLRQKAWQSAQLIAAQPEIESARAPVEPVAPVLELEFIAMYW